MEQSASTVRSPTRAVTLTAFWSLAICSLVAVKVNELAPTLTFFESIFTWKALFTKKTSCRILKAR